MPQRFYVETLGCPKNAVDSDKVVASLLADGLAPATEPGDADLVVVNTCAFIEAARQESIDVALALADVKREGAKLVVTGCMAERYGDELAAALPEADAVVGFAGEGALAEVVLKRKPTGVRDLLELPRPAPSAPWAYVKIAEGCDRACAFCAIPSFRGTQRSRTPEAIETEARSLVEQGVSELVLVAQDLAWYGRDADASGAIVPLLRRLDALSASGLTRIRLLYLYPVRGTRPTPHDHVRAGHGRAVLRPLAAARLRTVAPAHEAVGTRRTLPRRDREDPRARSRARPSDRRSSSGSPARPTTTTTSSFRSSTPRSSTGPGSSRISEEAGTPALALDGKVDAARMQERLRDCTEVQDPITAAARRALVGEWVDVLVDRSRDADGEPELIGRTYREAPEIDGIVRIVGAEGRPGATVRVRVTDTEGPDLESAPVKPERGT